MTFKFKRKRLLLSEKNKTSKAIGYARATHNEYEYLEEQIKVLKEEGCSLVFSEFINLDEEIKLIIMKKTNDQLDLFSNIYLKKIKKMVQINEF